MKNFVPDLFGSLAYNDAAMKERLPKDVYKDLKKTIEEGKPLDIDIANAVAHSMKTWALEKGATHYTHWFQPMTGVTAEKHDSFITPQSDGKVIMSFSGKELIKGEPDASSFPSGGLRATFEARGYTAWDPTSYAFIKDGILCIPTAFCSYGGEVLDKKTPLLRSMEVINKHALRILKLFGKTHVRRVNTTVGAEQEYFLIDKTTYEKRKDLIYTGKTLFGARPPKGQELDDHYFGAIKPRIVAYMKELDEELWKVGVLSKTKHNEVAPSQHELAPIFSTTNIATDHNQLTMEMMRKVALRHNLVCLLHEKPFAGVNGSGKHNNWSLSTNNGANLLEPGDNPHDNLQFLLFLCATIRAVDEYQDLLRLSVATAGNDHRLGANEAPPAIISMFLGDDLMAVLDSLEKGAKYGNPEAQTMETGVVMLPNFLKDTSDRNRTSPFAFTGNKFEFRMPGSSLSIAGPNIMINTAVADVLDKFATELEAADNFSEALEELIKRTIKDHKRIIFNGNNYSDEWVEEAKKRGLLNLHSASDALPHYVAQKNIDMFERHGVFSETEVRTRMEILMENYCKIISIEALTMVEMLRKSILPATSAYSKHLTETAIAKKQIGVNSDYEVQTATKIGVLSSKVVKTAQNLDEMIVKLKQIEGDDLQKSTVFCREIVVKLMEELRIYGDDLERITARSYWPFPTYGDILFSV